MILVFPCLTRFKENEIAREIKWENKILIQRGICVSCTKLCNYDEIVMRNGFFFQYQYFSFFPSTFFLSKSQYFINHKKRINYSFHGYNKRLSLIRFFCWSCYSKHCWWKSEKLHFCHSSCILLYWWEFKACSETKFNRKSWK